MDGLNAGFVDVRMWMTSMQSPHGLGDVDGFDTDSANIYSLGMGSAMWTASKQTLLMQAALNGLTDVTNYNVVGDCGLSAGPADSMASMRASQTLTASTWALWTLMASMWTSQPQWMQQALIQHGSLDVTSAALGADSTTLT